MESFINPVAGFTEDQPIKKIPRDTLLKTHPQTNTLTTTFKTATVPQWSWILEHLGLVFAAYHRHTRLMFCLAPYVLPEGFMRVMHFKVSESFIKRVALNGTNASGMPTIPAPKQKAICDMMISYVGAKSVISDSSVVIDDVNACTVRVLAIVIDPKTRRPGSTIDAAWKGQALQTLQRNGLANKQMEIPEYPTRRTFRHSLTIEVHENHIDYNNHTNYKFYLFGGIICFRKALESKFIPEYVHIDFSDVIVRDFVIVFEKECALGDQVEFELVQSEDGILFTACYCGGRRLSYTKLDVAQLKHES